MEMMSRSKKKKKNGVLGGGEDDKLRERAFCGTYPRTTLDVAVRMAGGVYI